MMGPIKTFYTDFWCCFLQLRADGDWRALAFFHDLIDSRRQINNKQQKTDKQQTTQVNNKQPKTDARK